MLESLFSMRNLEGWSCEPSIAFRFQALGMNLSLSSDNVLKFFSHFLPYWTALQYGDLSIRRCRKPEGVNYILIYICC